MKRLDSSSLTRFGIGLVASFVYCSAAQAQTQTFANWSSATAFRLGNVSCTAALGASANQTNSLLQNPTTLDDSGVYPNYPLSWFTPTPPVATKWSTGNLLGANAFQEFVVTCAQAIPTPRLHVVNLDTSQLELTTSATVTRLSGNTALVVSGSILNSDYGSAINAGCDTDGGGNPNGACGTVEISGSHTSLSFTNRRIVSSGDGWQWTLSANAWSIGGSVSGLGTGKTVTLRNDSGDEITVSADGSFTFPDGNIDTTTYSVTVATQPAGQICTVGNGTGTATGDVSNISISCSNVVAVPAAIPTLSGWATICMAALLAMFGIRRLRRG